MSKIYIVTSGQYSDYGIDAVFDDKEKAEQYKTLLDYDEVGEYELNPTVVYCPLNHLLYFVKMLISDGSSESHIYQRNLVFGDNPEMTTLSYDKKHIIVKVFATSKEHAVKIANEYRARYIATGELN